MQELKVLLQAFSTEAEEMQHNQEYSVADFIMKAQPELYSENPMGLSFSKDNYKESHTFYILFCYLFKKHRHELVNKWPFDEVLLRNSFHALGYSYE